MHKNQGPVYYGDYLELGKLLDTQNPLSKKYGDECHDETLFIIVHQVYELWFKQIIHEFRSVMEVFGQNKVEEKSLSTVVDRLDRVKKIQGLLLSQLEIMETMTPMDFLEFRDLLVPASGFQSAQFREIEISMGLSTKSRTNVDREYFLGRLDEADRKRLVKLEEGASLFDQIEKWLERLPFTQQEQFDFWDEYKNAVHKMLDEDEKTIQSNTASLGDKQILGQLENLKSTRETFDSLLDEKKHNDLRNLGQRRLSQKATLNALFILLFRDEPILHQPYKFLTSLMDIDENFTTWRYRHALMAHRMLGTKIGTGGSSGHQYLKHAAENNRVYVDIFDLSTFIIPRSLLPSIPEAIRSELDFVFNKK